jgi:hypothetical protein
LGYRRQPSVLKCGRESFWATPAASPKPLNTSPTCRFPFPMSSRGNLTRGGPLTSAMRGVSQDVIWVQSQIRVISSELPDLLVRGLRLLFMSARLRFAVSRTFSSR